MKLEKYFDFIKRNLKKPGKAENFNSAYGWTLLCTLLCFPLGPAVLGWFIEAVRCAFRGEEMPSYSGNFGRFWGGGLKAAVALVVWGLGVTLLTIVIGVALTPVSAVSEALANLVGSVIYFAISAVTGVIFMMLLIQYSEQQTISSLFDFRGAIQAILIEPVGYFICCYLVSLINVVGSAALGFVFFAGGGILLVTFMPALIVWVPLALIVTLRFCFWMLALQAQIAGDFLREVRAA